jgi:hypothetical protein
VSDETGRRTSPWRWLPDAGAIVAVAALVVVKCLARIIHEGTGAMA